MRIALINVSGRLSTEGSRLISALLKRDGHTVKFIFLPRKSPLLYALEEIQALDEVIKEVDLIMIAIYSLFAPRAVQVTKFIRNHYPGMMVIWGGPHCISAPKLSLRYADGVCFAEGDQAVVDLVNKLERGLEFIDTPNMAFNINGKQIINDVLPPFEDLDALPYPDYDTEDHYLLDRGLFPMTKELFVKHMTRYPFGKPTLWVLTSRGCPHRCSYCNNCRYISMYGRNPIRFRSVDSFISELQNSLKHQDCFERVGFGDDDFFMRSKPQLEEFSLKYKRKIDLPFIVAASANTYSREKLEILLDAGIKVIQVGVQSGSQRVLTEVFDRRVSVSKTLKVMREIDTYYESHGLRLILDFIIDIPYENETDILDTYFYLLDVPQRVRVNVFVLTFFPGSPIYERALRDGYIEPFSMNAFRNYFSRNIMFQNNYATLLIVFSQLLRYLKVLRYVPKWFLKALGLSPLRAVANLFPRNFYAFLIKIIRT